MEKKNGGRQNKEAKIGEHGGSFQHSNEIR